jgi:hypothetical protein
MVFVEEVMDEVRAHRPHLEQQQQDKAAGDGSREPAIAQQV